MDLADPGNPGPSVYCCVYISLIHISNINNEKRITDGT